jgi:GNAT superfamily N-acetyltransferase
VEIIVQAASDWLSADLPVWATRARFHARLVEREGVIVLTARDTSGAVGYALFDKHMTHLHYIETRKDCRRRGVASRPWARVREVAVHREITSSADTDDGRRRRGCHRPASLDTQWL